MPSTEIGRYSRIRRAIINTNVKIPESSVIGYDLDADRAAGYQITDAGIVVVS
jgi:glucose-1-phosphate adenylyltransferase